MSRAKKDIKRLTAYLRDTIYLNLSDKDSVEAAINMIEAARLFDAEPMKAKVSNEEAIGMAVNTVEALQKPQRTVVLVASNLAKQGQQPWSQWDAPMHEVVTELTERVKQNPHRPGFQYEVMEAKVIDSVVVETLVNVRGA